MKVFIRKPSIDMLAGIKVTKDTSFDYENDNVKQTLSDLTFHSVTKVQGENFKSIYDTTITLQEGDVLVFEEEGRGYIKPVEEVVTIEEAIQELEAIKGVGE
jgi:hypothetical protein